MRHVFSCEKDPAKRAVLLHDHAMEHLFGDVLDFRDGGGFCYTCGKIHNIDSSNCGIDVLESGPSCKDVSLLNTTRSDHAGCYNGSPEEEAHGTSGITYTYGFKKALSGNAILESF